MTDDFEQIADQQGWTDASRLAVLTGYIDLIGGWPRVNEHARKVQADENAVAEPEGGEWLITHTITQTVEAKTATEAERTARKALEDSHGLWWPSVGEEHDATPL